MLREAGRVVAAEDGLALEHGARAGGQVEVEHRPRRDERLEHHLQRARRRLRVVAEADGVQGLVERHVRGRAVARGRRRVARQQPQRRQPAGPQREHRHVLEGVDAEEPLAGGRRQQRLPLLVGRRVERGPGEVGVGVVGVVDDEKPVRSPARRRTRRRRAGGRPPGSRPRGRPPAAGAPPTWSWTRSTGRPSARRGCPRPPSRTARRPPGAPGRRDPGGSRPGAAKLEGPPGVVEAQVVDDPPVPGQLAPVADVGEGVVEDLPCRDVADGEGEPLVTGVVGPEGDGGVVRADREGAHREEVAVAGLDVAVEEHLLPLDPPAVEVGTHRPVGQRRPRVDGILQALHGARVVPPGAADDGDGQVGLLDPRADLLDDPAPQRLEVGGGGLGVGVLGLEVAKDLGVAGVAQPLVGVDDPVTVVLTDVVAAHRHRRRGKVGHRSVSPRSGSAGRGAP